MLLQVEFKLHSTEMRKKPKTYPHDEEIKGPIGRAKDRHEDGHAEDRRGERHHRAKDDDDVTEKRLDGDVM